MIESIYIVRDESMDLPTFDELEVSIDFDSSKWIRNELFMNVFVR